MKFTQSIRTIVLAMVLGFAGTICDSIAAEFSEALTKGRIDYRADRESFLAENLQLSEIESAAFWPLYREYRAELDALGDELVKLVLEYVDLYPNVPEERGQQLLKDYTALEEKLVKKRAAYLKRANKFLSAAKVLRWAQLENRMDLALRLQLAGAIPLSPPTPAKP
jgi:hypothetical protein